MKSEAQKLSKKNWELHNPDKVKAQRLRSYNRHAEQRRLDSAKWRIENPMRFKHNMLKAKYGITIEQYQEMLNRQNGNCAICEQQETVIDGRSGKVRTLAVDHCHSTKKIRGLLCGSCNKAIGCLKDSLELLQKAYKYLEKNIK